MVKVKCVYIEHLIKFRRIYTDRKCFEIFILIRDIYSFEVFLFCCELMNETNKSSFSQR